MRIQRSLALVAAYAILLTAPGAVAKNPTAAVTGAAPPPPASSDPDRGADSRLANTVLEDLKRRYRLLDGVTVTIGVTPEGNQAVSYYESGRIVISPTHVAGVEKILAHEIWHVIDWRDNSRIDWAEDLPPANAADYRAPARAAGSRLTGRTG